ncbi:rRNA pseudouridine synthase [Vagococcus sp. PNs007]|uniref:Pseudouridine synthase n=1 Tax=Vagococcus proximus TaxID=2991417 RepID=A0ABT5X3P0_9ENTE|nr:pseudouridine synthase [Vagococcus proximus]MDF0480622.1 rRNA pseudouridine synthase [Vagococcus proximus]
MRLDKFLEEQKQGSRKQVKRLLLSKQVTVDGEIVMTINYNVDPFIQEVRVKGTHLQGKAHRYIMLNKPQGVVTAVKDDKHQTVIDLIGEGPEVEGLFPVGRLDRDTEGLVFLTDNGQLAYQLAMADKKVVKRYEVRVNGEVTPEDVAYFKQGVAFLDGPVCRPAELRIIESSKNDSHCYLDIDEGKFHQVKKMFLSVGKKVTYLKRLSIGPIILDETLELGGCRLFSEEEREKLNVFFNSK